MSLNNKDKKVVKDLWDKISPSSATIGAETLGRLFTCYPQSKTYFAHWPDVYYGSESVKKHGKAIMDGVGLAVANIDDMAKGLNDLSEIHAFTLRIDPSNFKLMAHCFMVVLASMFPDDFTPEVHVSVDKFMANLTLALSERFR